MFTLVDGWGALQGVKAPQQIKSSGRSADAIFSDAEEIFKSVCFEKTKLVGTIRVTKTTHIVILQ